MLCLELKKTTYRDLVDEPVEMPRVRDALDLDSVPAPSTLYKPFDRLEMAVWRVVLNVSLANVPLNGATSIDASGFEWAYASPRYTKRTNLTIQQSKTTLLVDTATQTVLDTHVTTTRTHDTQTAPEVAKRHRQSIAVLTNDTGCDDRKLRRYAGDRYHKRNTDETVNAAIKQRFGALVRSRVWLKRFRDLVVNCLVHNLERRLAVSHEGATIRDREEKRPLNTEDASCTTARDVRYDSTRSVQRIQPTSDIRLLSATESTRAAD